VLQAAGYAVLHATWAGPVRGSRGRDAAHQATLYDAQETEGRT
jgi:hypothetical protein